LDKDTKEIRYVLAMILDIHEQGVNSRLSERSDNQDSVMIGTEVRQKRSPALDFYHDA
jgi:hypothetical protein